MLDRDAIAALLPHSGAMVLLDSVISWTNSEINCSTASHRSGDNPLRRGSNLYALCGVEYAAQAMAVHGALVRNDPGCAGLLASVRNVRIRVDHLDDIAEDLTIHAEMMIKQSQSFMYRFSIHGTGVPLLDGEAAVFLL